LIFRKKEASILNEEKKDSVEHTNQLFENLIGLTKSLKDLSVLSEEEYDELARYDAVNFMEAKMGAEGIYEAISKVNLEEITVKLRKELSEIKSNDGNRYVKLTKQLKIIDGMRRSKVDPKWTIVKVLPVLPPDLRPMVQLSGGRFATSDLNDLYRRVINQK
jgi:DNA-directed RNA polymerase subunit beta'